MSNTPAGSSSDGLGEMMADVNMSESRDLLERLVLDINRNWPLTLASCITYMSNLKRIHGVESSKRKADAGVDQAGPGGPSKPRQKSAKKESQALKGVKTRSTGAQKRKDDGHKEENTSSTATRGYPSDPSSSSGPEMGSSESSGPRLYSLDSAKSYLLGTGWEEFVFKACPNKTSVPYLYSEMAKYIKSGKSLLDGASAEQRAELLSAQDVQAWTIARDLEPPHVDLDRKWLKATDAHKLIVLLLATDAAIRQGLTRGDLGIKRISSAQLALYQDLSHELA